jgi:starvation-inducible DNA-binding protein
MTQSLDAPLADLLDIGLLAKHAHWNVRGPNFRPMHVFLDELADLARLGADEVAERAITLGSPADGRAKTIADTSSLPTLDAGPIDDRDVVTRFGAILDDVIARLHGSCADFEQDTVTMDLLVGLVGRFEKQAWMLRAQRA